MLKGIQNFLQYITDNWTTITIIIALVIGLYFRIKVKVQGYMKQSKEEKIANAKKQASEVIMKWITDAEMDYIDWQKAGSIKRSQVIEKVFEKFPVLATITNQDEIIAWIDETINTSLKDLRKIVAENQVINEDETDE
jgi:anionic cell wall polymer biosynthesis LytR-Cps2A-Psr (LCP) family protein